MTWYDDPIAVEAAISSLLLLAPVSIVCVLLFVVDRWLRRIFKQEHAHYERETERIIGLPGGSGGLKNSQPIKHPND